MPCGLAGQKEGSSLQKEPLWARALLCQYWCLSSLWSPFCPILENFPLFTWKRKSFYLEGREACIYSTDLCELGRYLRCKHYKTDFFITLVNAKDGLGVVFCIKNALHSNRICCSPPSISVSCYPQFWVSHTLSFLTSLPGPKVILFLTLILTREKADVTGRRTPGASSCLLFVSWLSYGISKVAGIKWGFGIICRFNFFLTLHVIWFIEASFTPVSELVFLFLFLNNSIIWNII